jgi:hypothetical protein
MDKQIIITAIKQLTAVSGGKPIGRERFARETGIRESEWYPHIWLRWSEALAEAGYSANKMTERLADDMLFQKYISLVRELGHFPVGGELKRKGKQDASFPSHNLFNRFGGKDKLIDAVAVYCRDKKEYQDILALCDGRERPNDADSDHKRKVATGWVYLMKSGRHYKIGKTVCVGQRSRQLAIQIPIPPKTVHAIETDDPSGVEAYWHQRFADKRGAGEWFELSLDDVKAFKRWKRIV